jgi:hypothetical protein
MRLHLRRGSEPSVLAVHAWRTLPETDEQGHFRTDRHGLVVFELGGVTDVSLYGWNEQNVLWDLEVSRTPEGWKIQMETSYGLAGEIVASTLAVRVEPFTTD